MRGQGCERARVRVNKLGRASDDSEAHCYRMPVLSSTR